MDTRLRTGGKAPSGSEEEMAKVDEGGGCTSAQDSRTSDISAKERCWVDNMSCSYFCIILLYQDGLVFQEPLGVRWWIRWQNR